MFLIGLSIGLMCGVIVTFIVAMNTIGKENFELKKLIMDEEKKEL